MQQENSIPAVYQALRPEGSRALRHAWSHDTDAAVRDTEKGRNISAFLVPCPLWMTRCDTVSVEAARLTHMNARRQCHLCASALYFPRTIMLTILRNSVKLGSHQLPICLPQHHLMVHRSQRKSARAIRKVGSQKTSEEWPDVPSPRRNIAMFQRIQRFRDQPFDPKSPTPR